MDIEGASIIEDFEFIEIMDKRNLYPSLLGFDWTFYMDAIINLKRSMVFENNGTKFVVPLDPSEGSRYIELIYEE